VGLAFHIALHKPDTMKYYNLSFGKITEDDRLDPDMVGQILNEVLAVVAPSNMAISYSVYMAPCYDDDDLNAYSVFSLIKCADPEWISSEFHAHLETVPKGARFVQHVWMRKFEPNSSSRVRHT
jgi:hypothetical protein